MVIDFGKIAKGFNVINCLVYDSNINLRIFKSVCQNAKDTIIFGVFEPRHKFVAQTDDNRFMPGFFQSCCPIKNIIDLFFAERLARLGFFNQIFLGVGSIAPHIAVPKDFTFQKQGIFAVVIFLEVKSKPFIACAGEGFGADDAALQCQCFGKIVCFCFIKQSQSIMVVAVEQLD